MKKLVIGGLVAAICFYLMYYFIAHIFPKWGLEIAGKSFLQTEVKIGSVELEFKNKKAAVNGLKISNPPGFKMSHAVKVKRIEATGVSKQDGMVTIEEVRILDPEVFFENGESGSNFKVLEKNLTQSLETFNSKGSDKKSAAENSKVIIKRLVISNTTANVLFSSAQPSPFKIDIPEIEMKNLGSEEGGTNMSNVIRQVLEKLSGSIVAPGQKFLKETGNKILNNFKF